MSDRALTDERVDWPQGAVPEPGRVVEKQPPPGAEGLTSRPGAGSLLANSLVCKAIREPQACRGVSPRGARLEADVPRPGPHPHHPLSRQKVATFEDCGAGPREICT